MGISPLLLKESLVELLVFRQGYIDGFSCSVSVQGKVRRVAMTVALCMRRNAFMGADRATLWALLWH